MTEKKRSAGMKELLKIIASVKYGKIVINKQSDKIVNVKKVESIKINNN